MRDFNTRARNALLGLALGDAVGWPAMFHRSRTLPAWTRRLRREIDTQREDAHVLRVPMPFSLNQVPDTFDLYPTDDAEWACWMMENLIQNRCAVTEQWVNESWGKLAKSNETLRGGVSTQAALENLRRGMSPPATGRDNPHYFDDGAICRAIPIGIAYVGRPAAAARAAEIEASVTNSEDGVWVASAVAAAIAAACAGKRVNVVLEAGISALPSSSWSRRLVEGALRIARREKSALSLIPALHGILNKEYSEGCVGPETLALAFAVVSRLGQKFEQATLTAVAFAKAADSVPPLVGAIAGALSSVEVIPARWFRATTLRGICFPSYAGRDYRTIAGQFVKAVAKSLKRGDR